MARNIDREKVKQAAQETAWTIPSAIVGLIVAAVIGLSTGLSTEETPIRCKAPKGKTPSVRAVQQGSAREFKVTNCEPFRDDLLGRVTSAFTGPSSATALGAGVGSTGIWKGLQWLVTGTRKPKDGKRKGRKAVRQGGEPRDYSVKPERGRWTIGLHDVVLGRYRTKKEAEPIATSLASHNRPSRLLIYGEDGRLDSEHPYDNE